MAADPATGGARLCARLCLCRPSQRGWPSNRALRDMTGLGARDYWFPDINSLPGLGFVLAGALYPYVYLTARAAFTTTSICALDAARTLGARPRRVFLSVANPTARPCHRRRPRTGAHGSSGRLWRGFLSRRADADGRPCESLVELRRCRRRCPHGADPAGRLPCSCSPLNGSSAARQAAKPPRNAGRRSIAESR